MADYNPFAQVIGLRAYKPAAAKPVAAKGDSLIGYLQKAGFKGTALKTAWAIAKRESGGRPEAYNPNRGTGDDSYGLFQINMLGDLGPARRRQYGLQSNEDLYDPQTNAQVAYKMSKGGTDFGAWGVGPNAYRKTAPLDFSGYPGASKLPLAKQAAAPTRTLPAAPDMSFESNPFAGVAGGANPFAPVFAGRAGRGSDNPFAVAAPPPGKTGLAHVSRVMEGNNIGAQAVQKAATQLGDKYVFGATSVGADPSSFDCSSLVQWSYAQLGIRIPRDTYGQQKALPLKPWADLQPGDPIYRKSGGHVVIYAGNGKVIAAPHTGTVVQYQSLANFPQDAWEVRSVAR